MEDGWQGNKNGSKWQVSIHLCRESWTRMTADGRKWLDWENDFQTS